MMGAMTRDPRLGAGRNGFENPFDFHLREYLRGSAAPLIIVAHPDDEVLGVGGQLARWPGAKFVHVTDGAPRNMRDALAAGMSHRTDYAALRRQELESALALAGFGSAAHFSLGMVDQEASTQLPGLAKRLAEIMIKLAPEAVITHPYEGGHPDHDGVAFAVRAACHKTQSRIRWAPVVIEMTSYHNECGLMRTGEFLPCADRPVVTMDLDAAQQDFKRQLLDCFGSQAPTLKQFRCDRECFRLAPEYSFRQPPHRGILYYEQYKLGMEGSQWRNLAISAMAELGIPG
jgi:LmbE family N-acetylglucosaminyl deacetylase